MNAAGTHIRAVQGHSIQVDPSKLLRQLESGDIGNMVPTCALHTTYFSYVPSIMRREAPAAPTTAGMFTLL